MPSRISNLKSWPYWGMEVQPEYKNSDKHPVCLLKNSGFGHIERCQCNWSINTTNLPLVCLTHASMYGHFETWKCNQSIKDSGKRPLCLLKRTKFGHIEWCKCNSSINGSIGPLLCQLICLMYRPNMVILSYITKILSLELLIPIILFSVHVLSKCVLLLLLILILHYQ